MNTLNLINKQIEKQEALRQAQLMHTAYRGVVYNIGSHEPKEVHGTFNYRGHSYSK